MREGIENRVQLRDVDTDTVESFVQWLYQGFYTCTYGWIDKGWLLHGKVYVLGDRFNIPQLQLYVLQQIQSKIQAWPKCNVENIGGASTKGDPHVVGFIKLIKYSYDNLPTRSGAMQDPLLHLFVGVPYSNLQFLKENCEKDYLKLLSVCPEFCLDLCRRSFSCKNPGTLLLGGTWAACSCAKDTVHFYGGCDLCQNKRMTLWCEYAIVLEYVHGIRCGGNTSINPPLCGFHNICNLGANYFSRGRKSERGYALVTASAASGCMGGVGLMMYIH